MRKFLIFILCIIIFISGNRVVKIYQEYQKAINYYEEIQNIYIKLETNTSPILTPMPTASLLNDNKITSNPISTTISSTLTPTPTITLEPYHTTNKKSPIFIDFSALKKKNKEVIGWIYSENTVINYPIMQTSNNVYYLRHLMDKSYSVSGSIFLDSINNKNFKDDNSILYGHHMRNGNMFASIEKYKKQSYYDEHPELWLLTPIQNYLLMPFAGLVVTPSRENYFMREFKSDSDQQAYIKFALENSTFVGELAPNAADRIITLTTCDYTFKNARFILICTMLPVV